MGGKPVEEFLGTPSKSVLYHPRNMSGKFGAIGRHVTISRLRALTTTGRTDFFLGTITNRL